VVVFVCALWCDDVNTSDQIKTTTTHMKKLPLVGS
jgi:hypothetical protein